MTTAADPGRYWPIIGGFKMGAFDIPTEVKRAHEIAQELAHALDAVELDTPPNAPHMTDALLIDETVKAVTEGKDLPTASDIARLDAERRDAGRLAEIRRQARDRGNRDLRRSIVGLGDTIISDFLRPALATVVKSLKRSSKTEGAASRYLSIRSAYECLMPEDALALGAATHLHEIRNRDELWPDWKDPRGSIIVLTQRADPTYYPLPPWPTDTEANRLSWLVAHGAELWLPFPAELEAAYDEDLKKRNARLSDAINAKRSPQPDTWKKKAELGLGGTVEV